MRSTVVLPDVDQLANPDPETFAMDCVVISEFEDMLIDVEANQRGHERVGVIEQER